jgi:hypothetical protein
MVGIIVGVLVVAMAGCSCLVVLRRRAKSRG